jgi:adenylyltransferase/sulfurtransferase
MGRSGSGQGPKAELSKTAISRAGSPSVGAVDPIERRPIGPGESVIRCAGCGAYQLTQTWESSGRRCAACGHDRAWAEHEEPFAFTDADFQASRDARETQAVTPSAAHQAGPNHGSGRNLRVSRADLPTRRRLRVERPHEPGSVEPDDSGSPEWTRQQDRSRIEGAGWDTSVLDRARVLVVGAGAIGNEVLKNLALAGVGSILIVDLDAVEASNLTRSVLFTPEDVGQPKAQVAAKRLAYLEGRLTLQPLQGRFQELFGPGALRRFDAAFCCVDNIQARIDLAKLCLATRTPMIEGGVDGLSGQASIWLTPEGACYDCTQTEDSRSKAGRRTSCPGVVVGEAPRPTVPFTPTISSLIGAVMSQWGLQAIHGRFADQPSQQFSFQSLHVGQKLIQSTDLYRLQPSAACPTHRTWADEAGFRVPVDGPIEGGVSLGDTAATLLGRAGESGKWAEPLELRLGYDFAPWGACFRCGERFPIERRFGEIPLSATRCANGCLDAQGLASTVQPSFVGEHDVGWLTAENELTRRPLKALGVRPYDLLEVRSLSDGSSVWFEAAGDEETRDLFGPIDARPIRPPTERSPKE